MSKKREKLITKEDFMRVNVTVTESEAKMELRKYKENSFKVPFLKFKLIPPS